MESAATANGAKKERRTRPASCLLLTAAFSAKLEHMSEKVIRASEISAYVYCRRAWWLSRVAGYRPENAQALARGTRYHEQHGRLVRGAVWGRRLAYGIFFVVVAIFVFLLVSGA